MASTHRGAHTSLQKEAVKKSKKIEKIKKSSCLSYTAMID
jgi:hypothetical protein